MVRIHFPPAKSRANASTDVEVTRDRDEAAAALERLAGRRFAFDACRLLQLDPPGQSDPRSAPEGSSDGLRGRAVGERTAAWGGIHRVLHDLQPVARKPRRLLPPAPLKRSRPLSSKPLGRSQTLSSVSGDSNATCWQAAQSTFTKSPCPRSSIRAA